MNKLISFCLVLSFITLPASAQSSKNAKTPSVELKMFVQGDTSRLPDFVDSMRREFGERGMKIDLVERSSEYDYNVVIAQESSLGGAAAAVIMLDRSSSFVASVVRSGRWSGKGAFNAAAKELAKKIALLKGI